jgi:hypothetical protein
MLQRAVLAKQWYGRSPSLSVCHKLLPKVALWNIVLDVRFHDYRIFLLQPLSLGRFL